MLLLEAFLLIYLTMAISQFAFALVGKVVKVRVEEISLGVGWTLLRLGVVRVKLFPISGSTRFLSLESEGLDEENTDHVIELLPLPEKLLIHASAPLLLFLLGLGIHGADALAWFLSTFRQFFTGAFSPLSTAQELIESFEHDLRTKSLLFCFGLVSIKQSALTLLGNWYNWINIFAPNKFHLLGIAWFLSTILFLVCWLIAVCYYFWQQFSG